MSETLFLANDMDIVENRFVYAQSREPKTDVEMYFTLALKGHTGTVVAASNDTPIEIECADVHGLETGDQIVLFGVGGNTAARGTWTVTVTSTTTFTLDDSAGNGDWTDGGTWYKAVDGAAGIAMPYSSTYQEYVGVLPGTIPLLLGSGIYVLVRYALGSYRDKWHKIEERVNVRLRS